MNESRKAACKLPHNIRVKETRKLTCSWRSNISVNKSREGRKWLTKQYHGERIKECGMELTK